MTHWSSNSGRGDAYDTFLRACNMSAKAIDDMMLASGRRDASAFGIARSFARNVLQNLVATVPGVGPLLANSAQSTITQIKTQQWEEAKIRLERIKDEIRGKQAAQAHMYALGRGDLASFRRETYLVAERLQAARDVLSLRGR